MEVMPEKNGVFLTVEEMAEVLDLVERLSAELDEVSPQTSLEEDLEEDQEAVKDATTEALSFRKKTYCCRYWVGDRNSSTNPNRRKINIRTYTQVQADVICVARRTRDFGTASGSATVSRGGCNDDDWQWS